MLAGCEPSMSVNDYFSTVPVNEINNLSIQDVSYKKESIAYDYIGLGTYEEPQIANDMRYDSTSEYKVLVFGYISVSDTDGAIKTQNVDSVAISHFIFTRYHHKPELFSKTTSAFGELYKPWRKCPVPKSVRKRIRNDFLTRMKYRIYHIETDLRKLPVQFGYSL